MVDQAEEIRRRLEARSSGNPLPPPPIPPSTPPVFQPPEEPVSRATSETAHKRKLEAAIENTSLAQPVVVVDINIKFWSMVRLLVTLTFAGIPAMIIVAILVFAFVSILRLIFFPFGGN